MTSVAASPKSIALFRLSALGDVLMYLPTVRAFQRAFPQCQLSWIISQPAYDLVKHIQGIEFILIDKPRSWKDYWKLYKQFKKQHFDVLIASQASFRAHLLYPLIRAKRKIGYDKIRGQEGHSWFVNEQIPFREVHTLEGFMQFAEHLGVRDTSVEWNISLDPVALAWVEAQLQNGPSPKSPLVVLNPAASKPERSWTAERYIQVIQYLQQQYQARVILCGGPSAFDRQLADAIQEKVTIEDWVGKTRIPQLLSLISKAQLVICPDTGPSHMAAALGIPVIALHGVTKPEISGPFGQLEHTVNVYPEARAQWMNKKREQNANQWFLKVHHPEVMNLIQVDAVCQKIDNIFQA
jgi:heptosyltransferase I